MIKPKAASDVGIAVECGINPKLSDIDPFTMAQSAVDESVRNVLCVSADFGQRESVLALVDNFCWPDPVGDPLKSGWLVRACYGLRDAALALSAPLVSRKDSMILSNYQILSTTIIHNLAVVGRIRYTQLHRTHFSFRQCLVLANDYCNHLWQQLSSASPRHSLLIERAIRSTLFPSSGLSSDPE